MARHRPRPGLVKLHRSYTVDEAATLHGVHPNTVRAWLRSGLQTCDSKWPILIVGRDLADFLNARRRKNKRPCEPGQIYCVRCREPRWPAGGFAEYRPMTKVLGSLVGICPVCDRLIYRRVSLAKLEQARGRLEITISQAPLHIDESTHPIENSDFGRNHGHGHDTQR